MEAEVMVSLGDKTNNNNQIKRQHMGTVFFNTPAVFYKLGVDGIIKHENHQEQQG